jgi:hypothetical protein
MKEGTIYAALPDRFDKGRRCLFQQNGIWSGLAEKRNWSRIPYVRHSIGSYVNLGSNKVAYKPRVNGARLKAKGPEGPEVMRIRFGDTNPTPHN